MPVSSSTEHWIKPEALKINLNHFGDPDYLQVSVLAGAVVMAFKQDVIDYNAAHNYRTWPLDAANTYLETPSAYHVYARLTRSDVNARALVIYDPVLRDIEGREITYVTDEETGKETEQLGEASEDFYYIFLGKISSSVSESGSSVLREWESDYRSGTLETNQQQNDLYGMLGKMFRPHYDDPLDPDKLTWIEALTDLGVAGGITSFIENEKFDLPGIYDGLEIDNQTIVWEEINGVKTLVAKGGGEGTIKDISISGSGNAITNVSLNSDKTGLVFTKGLEFVDKTFLSENYFNKTYVDEHFITKEDATELFVTIGEPDQEITSMKNFTGGLQVNGCELVYDSVNKYWKLEGDLLVTGGITSFADSTAFDPSEVMDALVLDPKTLEVNSYGQLTVIGGTSGASNVQIVSSIPSGDDYKANTLYVVV